MRLKHHFKSLRNNELESLHKGSTGAGGELRRISSAEYELSVLAVSLMNGAGEYIPGMIPSDDEILKANVIYEEDAE